MEYAEVKNSFVEVKNIHFAYRKIGKQTKYPLILLMHTRGNMDSWDPGLVDLLAKERTVIAFDNKGVGLTDGKAPDSFEEMADDAANFIRALGYHKVDILGFSIGGAIGQELLIRHSDLIHRAILAGTSARGGEGLNTMSDKSKSVSTKSELTENDLLYGFFTPTSESQELGKQFLKRIKLRKLDLDAPVSMETAKAQAIARENWGHPQSGYEQNLRQIGVPVLIANGKNDIRMPTINSYHLFQALPNAILTLYPDSGHGFLFQFSSLCAEHFNEFLNQSEVH